MEKSGKIFETVMLTWKMQVSLLITDAFVNFLAFRDTKHLKFKVQKFGSSSVFRMEEYTVWEISAFKSQFCNVFSDKDKQDALKSLEKEVILSWKILENHCQISIRTL